MTVNKLLISSLSLVFAASFAHAQDTPTQDPEKQQLKQELQDLKDQQKQMQDAFEKRIKTLEDKLSKSQPAAPKANMLSGFGPIQFDGVVQGRFDTDSAGNDTFWIRRSELKLSGRISSKADWAVMIDPAKTLKLTTSKTAGNVTDVSVDQSSKILQDAWVGYQFTPQVRAEVGQQKVPFSYEGLHSASALDVIERALFLSVGKYGDIRDIGLQVKGKWDQVQATAAVMNGEGESQNNKDSNPQKAVGGRVVFAPTKVKGLQVGVSGLTEIAPNENRRDRVGAEIQYKNDKLTLRAEYAAALQDKLRGFGWYAHAGYYLNPKLEGVLRYDTFTPDRNTSASKEEDWLGGLNYYLTGNTKVQVNYIHKRFFNGLPINNQLLISYQVAW